jgi:hypothetical protein
VQLFIRSRELSVVRAGCWQAKLAKSNLRAGNVQPSVWNYNDDNIHTTATTHHNQYCYHQPSGSGGIAKN